MTRRLLIMAISLTIANYFCAAVGLTNWASAMDRSFFQGTALLYVWVAMKFDPALRVDVSGEKQP